MSQDKKRKAVPSWTPHPMPGMLSQTGPSAEAREELIKSGIWKGDAPNREVAQRGPLNKRPAPAPEERLPESVADADNYSIEESGEVNPDPHRPPDEEPADVDLEESSDWFQVSDPIGVAPTPFAQQEQVEAGVAPTPSRCAERFDAGVAPTPSSSQRRADVSENAQRRQADAFAGVAPTPSRRVERFDTGVALTPSSGQRRADASASVTPASPRHQRQPDASNISPPLVPGRRRAVPSSGIESTPPRPRRRRGSAAPGRVQSPRDPEKHEADERVRRTLRITPKVDQHLHALALLLGLDLNGALSVAIVEHHLYLLHRRGPTET